jgi:hypothetical protein
VGVRVSSSTESANGVIKCSSQSGVLVTPARSDIQLQAGGSVSAIFNVLVPAGSQRSFVKLSCFAMLLDGDHSGSVNTDVLELTVTNVAAGPFAGEAP